MRLAAIGIVLIGAGALYFCNPNVLRRSIWTRTSSAIRLRSPEAYVRYLRGLGFAHNVIGIGLVICGMLGNARNPDDKLAAARRPAFGERFLGVHHLVTLTVRSSYVWMTDLGRSFQKGGVNDLAVPGELRRLRRMRML